MCVIHVCYTCVGLLHVCYTCVIHVWVCYYHIYTGALHQVMCIYRRTGKLMYIKTLQPNQASKHNQGDEGIVTKQRWCSHNTGRGFKSSSFKSSNLKVACRTLYHKRIVTQRYCIVTFETQTTCVTSPSMRFSTYSHLTCNLETLR